MRNRLASTERIFFAQQLSTYLRAGIPLIRALDLTAASMRPAHAALFTSIIENVRVGAPLSSSLASHTGVFSPLYCEFVAAGEASGRLSSSLERISLLLIRRQKLMRDCVAAIAYPAVVCLGTIGTASLLLLYAFPKIIPLFVGMHVPLPVTTRVLITVSDLISKYFLPVTGLGAGLLVAFALSYRTPRVKACSERIVLALPFIGTILRGFILTNLFRMLSELLESGLPIISALSFVRESVPSILYQETVRDAEERLLRGAPLSAGMKQFPKHYPTLVVQLIEVGEQTGTLPESALAVSEFLETQLERDLALLSASLEPLLLLITGSIVGFVALAVISPMYQITQSISL